MGKKRYKLSRKEFTEIRDQNFFSENSRYDYFRKKITLDTFFEEKDKVKVKFCLKFSEKPYAITLNYGEKVNVSKKGKTYGDYRVICKKDHIVIISDPDKKEVKV